jgi:hypothetical protein
MTTDTMQNILDRERRLSRVLVALLVALLALSAGLLISAL